MPKVKKLPKWAIKQAGGINKKAWALARRGKGRKMAKAKPSKRAPRRTPRAVGGASHSNNKWGWGRWAKMGRTVDIFSGPAQGAVARHGATREAGVVAANRYVGGDPNDTSEIKVGTNIDTIKSTAGGIGTGLFRDWIRSKMGVYRGLGRKKILSGVMAANPEILASSEVNPLDNVRFWNNTRVSFDRAYAPDNGNWALSPDTFQGSRFWKSIGLDAGLKVTQKVAEIYLNPMLPPGWNL